MSLASLSNIPSQLSSIDVSQAVSHISRYLDSANSGALGSTEQHAAFAGAARGTVQHHISSPNLMQELHHRWEHLIAAPMIFQTTCNR